MSAAADLAQYAGGDQVVAEANKVENANPGAITEAANRLTAAASAAGTSGTEVANAVRGLDTAWEGASADQFVSYMDKFGKAGTDVGTSMTQAAEALNRVAEAIGSAKAYIAGRCEQALAEIRGWIAANPEAEQSQLDAYTRGICGGVAGDIRAQLQGTEATLAAAVGVLNGAKTPASTFSAIPDPNTQPFTPQPGRPIDWAPTPQEQTAPSGAGTPANGQPGNGSGAGQSGGTGGGGGGLSSGGGGGGGLGSSGGPPAGGPPPGNVQEWIRQAIEILRANGINVSDADAQHIWQIIQHESGGNPHAINNWDSNAAKGTPSKGLMQTIDPTFNSYKLPGHGDIWNPVDNICAGVNYAISRYGSLANVPGIRAMAGGGAYRGY